MRRRRRRIRLLLLLLFTAAVSNAHAFSYFTPDQPGKITYADATALSRADFAAVVLITNIDAPIGATFDYKVEMEVVIPVKGALPKTFKHCTQDTDLVEELRKSGKIFVFLRKNPLDEKCLTRSGSPTGPLEYFPYSKNSERFKLIRNDWNETKKRIRSTCKSELIDPKRVVAKWEFQKSDYVGIVEVTNVAPPELSRGIGSGDFIHELTLSPVANIKGVLHEDHKHELLLNSEDNRLIRKGDFLLVYLRVKPNSGGVTQSFLCRPHPFVPIDKAGNLPYEFKKISLGGQEPKRFDYMAEIERRKAEKKNAEPTH